MKKTLLLFAMLLGVVGAWAQTPVLTYTNITAPQELSAEDAKTIREMSVMTIVAEVDITRTDWMSLLFAAVADTTSSSNANNSMWGLGVGGNSMRYVVGPREGGWYSSNNGDISTATKKIAFTYNGTTIGCFNAEGHVRNQTSTKSLNTFNGEKAKFYLGGMTYNTNTTWGSFNGKILSVRIYNSVLTAEQIANLPNCFVREIDEFKNGQIYTFVTERGWLGARTDNDNLISTAHNSNNDLQPSKDEPNFQWTVYKSNNNRYYLYNLGKKKFVGNQDNNNQAIPFVDEPTTKKLTFKKSSSGEYSIMFSTNKTGVVNHSSAQAHSCGIVNWKSDSEGWNKLNDTGSNHKIEDVGDLDEETLALIEAAVAKIEADNTEEVATLRAIITKTENYYASLPIGVGMGQYSSTNENYANDLATIKTFSEGITTTTEPTIDVLDTKIAEMEALYASIQLNLPQTGKFYRIKAVSGWNDDAPYLGAKNSTVETARAEYVAYNGNNNKAESANTIFYYDGTNLVSYGSGHYLVSNSNFLGYNAVQTTGSKIQFYAASNNLVGAYNISFNNGGRWLYVNQNNYTDAGGRGTEKGYCFNIEEVEYLPVPMNVNAAYATLYSPVALSTYRWHSTSTHRVEAYVGTINNNGKFSMVRIDAEDGVIPANTPVVLKYVADAETVGNNSWVFLAVSDSDKETPENNELNGTFADAYITDDAYVLSYVNVAEDGQPEEKEIGFYTATKNQQNGASWLNNGFKAYLPKPEASEARFFVFDFGGNETGIESVEGENGNVKTEVYDLSGRRVQNAKKGIYVVNGKVVVK